MNNQRIKVIQKDALRVRSSSMHMNRPGRRAFTCGDGLKVYHDLLNRESHYSEEWVFIQERRPIAGR